MNDNGLEFFIDDFESCINEVVISGNECIENDEDEISSENLISENLTLLNEESYLSESTEPMTDSDAQSNYTLYDHIENFKNETTTFRDISNSNQLSHRCHKAPKRKRKSNNDSETEPITKLKKTDLDAQSEYYVGRILWAKVKSHPWWPCMIFQSPDNNFYRELSTKKTIHVAYFGPHVERGWVNVKDTMQFEGKVKFDEYVKQLHENNAPKYILQQFSVSSSKLQTFNESWKEAEEAMLMSLEDRIQVHGISYRKLYGDSSSSDSDDDVSKIAPTKTTRENNKNELLKKTKMSLTNDNQFEFERLKLPAFNNCKRSSICFLCLEENDESTGNVIVNCAGCCGQQFHLTCLRVLFDYLTSKDVTTKEISYDKCVDCNRNVRRCFVCQKVENINKKDDMIKCSASICGRYFHQKCLYPGPFEHMMTHSRNGSLTCPSHICHACYIDDPGSVRHCTSHVRCLMCPAAFHRGEWCIPAGSKEISAHYIICPQHLPMGGASDITISPFIDCVKNGIIKLNSIHFKITSFNDPTNKDLWQLNRPFRSHKSRPNNVTWCFLCSKGGNLVCCEKCPASFHQKCADIKDLPEMFICEECQIGKYPRYGEIYWLKIGSYRWWPGQIIHPTNAPERVLKAPHGEGQFLVRFFGTNDYYWMNKTHAFPFEEGDDLTGDSKKIMNDNSSMDDSSIEIEENSNRKLDRQYQISLKIAGKALASRSIKWLALVDQKNKPSQYRSIKTNIPIGNVRINKLVDLSEAPQCECRPDNAKNNQDPCGQSSDCMNRELMYECHPQICRNGDKCRNQRFIRREYPKQEIFHTNDRGWALRVLEPLKKGDFVNEYVGELIDEAEASRRLTRAHHNNITNFYMMELDGQRIIDAGPAANLSRFMNHSCSPNLCTQKWTVNGDTRIGLFALHDIKPGEELTFNYNFFSLGQTKIQCKCGASNCSGFLGDPPKNVSSSSDIVSLCKDRNSECKKSKNVPNKKSEKKVLTQQKKNSVNKKSKKYKASELLTSSSLPLDDFVEDCYRCGECAGELICSYDDCSRVYHLECVDLKHKPKSLWLCPLHYCDDCGRFSDHFCTECTTSFCSLHRPEQLSVSLNEFICSNHEDYFLSHGSPSESQNGSTNAAFSINGTDSLPSISI